MKTNTATDNLQSQRLLRCGVPADTADMTGVEPDYGYECEPWSEMQGHDTRGYFPAWSPSALLGLLPDIITYGGYKWGMFMTKLSKDCVCISYARWDNFNSTIGHLSGDSIEACVKAIEWLMSNGYKLNEQ